MAEQGWSDAMMEETDFWETVPKSLEELVINSKTMIDSYLQATGTLRYAWSKLVFRNSLSLKRGCVSFASIWKCFNQSRGVVSVKKRACGSQSPLLHNVLLTLVVELVVCMLILGSIQTMHTC